MNLFALLAAVRSRSRSLASAIVLLASALGARAGVAYEQPHNGSATIFQSSRFAANGTDYDQFVWDSFSVPTAQAITEIRWRGGYEPAKAYWGGQITNFRVSIYGSILGNFQPYLGAQYPWTPVTLIAYDTGDNAGETSAGMFNGVEMFDYHFVLPTVFQAAAGVVYWVQIEADEVNGIPDWGLAAGAGGNGSYFRRVPNAADFYFQMISGDAAFSLVTSDGPTYTIAASASPAGTGTIANAGLYPSGSAAPLVATPAAGYAFSNWTENGAVVSTAANYTFTVTRDRTLVANFAPGSVITTSASPGTGGTTTGDGIYVNGRTITVQAAPSGNYSFVNWTENGAPVSSDASYTFTVSANRNLVANFTATATNLAVVFTQPPLHTSTILPSAFLTPDGIDGQCYAFEKFSAAATAEISEVRWRGGYDPAFFVPSNPVVEFVIKFYASTANGFYVDFTQPVLKKVTVAGNANETPAEVINGVQMYDYSVTLPTSFHAIGGTPYWIQIEASQAIYPLTWGFAAGSGGNNSHFRQTTGAPSSNRSGDLAITLLAASPTSYDIAASPAGAGGTVSGADTYAPGASVTLQASADAGYAFVNWTEDGTIVSTSAAYQFTATASRTLLAHFAPTYPLTLATSSATMGTVAGAGTFLTGATATATASPKAGYVFLYWKEGAAIVSRAPSYSFTVTAARSLVAQFAVGFNVSASSSFAPGGTVLGAGGYATGGAVTLSAAPATGYRFRNWSEGGVVVSADANYTFSANAAHTLVANFVPIVDLAPGAASDTLRLAWPASATGWVLEESADLSAGSWAPSPRAIATSGGQSEVLVSAPSGAAYFRLSHP